MSTNDLNKNNLKPKDFRSFTNDMNKGFPTIRQFEKEQNQKQRSHSKNKQYKMTMVLEDGPPLDAESKAKAIKAE